MAKFQNTRAAGMLYDLGVRVHASGVLREANTKAALYDFYKTDFLTESQREAITKKAKDVAFRGAFAEYAPEMRGIYICFPKAAWYRGEASGALA